MLTSVLYEYDYIKYFWQQYTNLTADLNVCWGYNGNDIRIKEITLRSNHKINNVINDFEIIN